MLRSEGVKLLPSPLSTDVNNTQGRPAWWMWPQRNCKEVSLYLQPGGERLLECVPPALRALCIPSRLWGVVCALAF